ncbi:hypothetical protein [Phenylobacterium kunshanense]|uniref:Uncharacterized protein n=1 Tax=Phenylobacterium kunshanense TaxID=1445034 RepID=A0A328BA02_9CAUL|nr:hypothetical protein [Phenylobacterium kunshanense]RAK62544.1 hypothetical protein DJ019_19185 [Phenylobacterium kunshanense]
MVEGFVLVDAEVGWTHGGSGWWIVRLEYDLEPEYTRRLTVTLQNGRDGPIANVSISGVTSFRVQDEREMHDFAVRLRREGVASGMFYTVTKSGYLSDFGGGVSAAANPQTHYIVVAEDDCLEFIGPAWASDFQIEITCAA